MDGGIEKRNVLPDTTESSDAYRNYVALGGHLNAEHYEDIRAMAKDPNKPLVAAVITQAEHIAIFAEIECTDEVIALYGAMRNDSNLPHRNRSDQRIFAEALRMVGDGDSLHKLIVRYPTISSEDVISHPASPEPTTPVSGIKPL